MSSNLVQYIILRSDLCRELKWTVGSLIAQACHATAAVTHLYQDDVDMQQYLKDLDNMHKVVLDAPNEEALVSLAESLSRKNILHKLWIEQPENIPTCLVIKPYPKTTVRSLVSNLKLYKD